MNTIQTVHFVWSRKVPYTSCGRPGKYGFLTMSSFDCTTTYSCSSKDRKEVWRKRKMYVSRGVFRLTPVLTLDSPRIAQETHFVTVNCSGGGPTSDLYRSEGSPDGVPPVWMSTFLFQVSDVVQSFLMVPHTGVPPSRSMRRSTDRSTSQESTEGPTKQ